MPILEPPLKSSFGIVGRNTESMASLSDLRHKQQTNGYSLFAPVIHAIALSITLYNLSFINWRALAARKPVPVLVLLTIVFTSFACISQIIQHTPFCEGENSSALICTKVLDLVFSVFDAFMALTISYGMSLP
jgi:uncharacterized membrane protein (UPF0136 family)